MKNGNGCQSRPNRRCLTDWITDNGMEIMVAAVIFIFVWIGFAIHREETIEMPRAFAAWVKLTGNEKNLTYQEWRDLVEANKKQADNTFIYIHSTP